MTPLCWGRGLVGSQGMCTEDGGCHSRVQGRHDGANLLGHAQCFDDDGREDDDLAVETLGENLAGDGHGVTLNKGVPKDFPVCEV